MVKKMLPAFASIATMVLLFGVLSAAKGPLADDTPVDSSEREKIEQVIADYLEKNPDVVIRAIQEYQRRQQMAQIDLYRDYLESDESAPVLGNPNGDVTLIEFFDFRCGFCRRHFVEVMKLVSEDGNIRFIPKQFPVLDQPDAPPVSRIAARAALAAQRQGKYADLHTALLTSEGGLDEDTIYKVAEQTGLDIAQLKKDMRDPLIEKTIENTLAIGREMGIQGTPFYIIGDDFVNGARGFDYLKDTVSRVRDRAAAERAAGR